MNTTTLGLAVGLVGAVSLPQPIPTRELAMRSAGTRFMGASLRYTNTLSYHEADEAPEDRLPS